MSASVPDPPIPRPPVPLISPAKLLLAPPPSVRLVAPSATWLPATPDKVPIVCGELAALRSNTAVAPARLTAPPAERLPPVPNASVPLSIVVPPVKLFAPVRVSVPVPPSVSPPVPVIAPPNVLLPAPPMARLVLPNVTWLPATPESRPIVCGDPAPLTSNTAPAPARLTPPVAARLPPAPIASVPLSIVVPPV